MQLTPSQIQTVKTWLIANASAMTEAEAAAALNANASPNYFVWKSTLGRHDLTDESGVDTDGTTATNFVWGGTAGGYINRSQGERDAFRELFNATDTCRPSLANVRTAMDDIFSGAGAGAQANRAHWRARFRRPCTVVEKLFVAATVGGPTQTGNRGLATNPDTLVVDGSTSAVTEQNVSDWRIA